MTTPVLIGVGGTGQTVLAAYLRLASIAGFTPAPFFIVDSDTRGPLGNVVAGLRGGVTEVLGAKEPPMRWTIDPFPTTDTERKTFGSLFGHLTGDRRELFHCLFSEEAEQTPIRTGMYGRPSVGATCIRHKILQDDADLRELKQALKGGEKHVILVGSCFGGTGSGGVPMLASELHRLSQEEPGYRLKVDAVVFLPWFRLVPPEGGLKQQDQGLHEHLNKNFEPNAAAGIYYFKDQMRERVDTLVLLGVPDPSQVVRQSSESAQGEDPHILNLLAAILIQNHFSGTLKPPTGIAGYWFDPKAGLRAENLFISRGGGGDSITMLQAIHRAYLKQQWLGILANFFENLLEMPRALRPAFLDVAINRASGTTRSERQVTAAIAEHMGSLRERAREHVTWVQSMADPGFFPLAQGAEKVHAESYDDLVANPLHVIRGWCDDKEVVSRFAAEDFRSVDTFCGKFSHLFINHLTEVLSL